MTTATPIDSTQGTIKEATFSNISRATAGQGVTYKKTYKRTYVHYLNNANTTPPTAPTSTFTYTAMTTAASAPMCNCYSEGAYLIPYHNLGISTIPGQWLIDFVNVDKVRVLELGFNVKNITVLQESLVNRGSTTTVENVFEGKPYAMMWIDREHMMDQNLGYVVQNTIAPMTTAEAAHVQWAMCGGSDGGTTQASVRSWNSLPSQPTGLDPNLVSTNNYMLNAWPATQANGELPHVGFYVQDSPAAGPFTTFDTVQRPNAIFANTFRFALTDIFDTQIISEGDKPSHTWKNPKPDWRAITTPNHGWVSQSTRTSVFSPASFHQSTSFPPNRQDAMAYSYRRFQQDDQTAAGMNQYLKDHDYYNSLTDAGALDAGTFESFKPPNVYFKVAPILGPVGTTNITMQVMIEYTMTLEMHIARSGTMTSYLTAAPASTTQLGAYNLYSNINCGVQMDPRGYTGANNSFWSGDTTGTPNNTTAAERRKLERSRIVKDLTDICKQDGSKRARTSDEQLEEHHPSSD